MKRDVVGFIKDSINEDKILNKIQSIHGEQLMYSLNEKINNLTDEDSLFGYLSLCK